jgi:hypothetical protein
MPWSGEQVWCHSSEVASNEAESHVRGWVARVRRGLTRGAAKPSSEAGTRPRGR